jgi:hypothetical protein
VTIIEYASMSRPHCAAFEELDAKLKTLLKKPASDLPAACPYVGGCNSLTSQPTSPDFIGSDAIAIFSTRLHLEQSNVRSSNPVGPGEMRASVMRVWHFGQRSR